MTEKAKYRVLRLSHIHNQLWEEGAEIEYDGQPGSALEPLNDAAKSAKAIADKRKGVAVAVEAAPVNADAVIPQDDSGTGAISADLASLRQQYEELFNEKPGNRTAETLSKAIADKRQELGI